MFGSLLMIDQVAQARVLAVMNFLNIPTTRSSLNRRHWTTTSDHLLLTPTVALHCQMSHRMTMESRQLVKEMTEVIQNKE
jgi:hypothetical protein